MIKRFLSSYFGFNKQQRQGLFILVSISFFLLIIRLTYPYFIKPDPIEVYNLPMMERIFTSSIGSNTYYTKNENRQIINSYTLIPFNPNTATSQQLANLGFSKKTAGVLIKFRNKGFVFKQKTDLKKVYGISDTFYVRLEPFILLEKENFPSKTIPTVTIEKTESSKFNQANQTIELNSADSLQLISINGIGNTYVKRIIKYRSLLGGFVALEQLKEVYGLTEEVYVKVKDKFTLNTSNIKKININTDDFKVINKHPYISYELSKIIFDWRKKTSINVTNLKDILKDDVLYKKLLPYLSF